METIITAVIATCVIGVLAGALLVIASKVMYVKTDPRVEQLRNALPGANCGACGFSGCDGYAAALAGGEVAADLCPPGGADTYKQITQILGIDGGDGPVKKTALICCGGDLTVTGKKINYEGIQTCFASNEHYGGHNACSFGCLGFGDCIAVCPAGAVCISGGIARIDPRKCGGCGLCAAVCPRGIIEIVTEPVNAAVLCRNTEKGAAVRRKCTKGCIACSKCVKECPKNAISIKDNLAVVDREKCDGCGHCAQICIAKCIIVKPGYEEAV